MKTAFLEHPLLYDGTQIQSLWAYRSFGIQGDSIVAFLGGCDIPFEHMVDQEDVRGRKRIWSPLMLHFIVEQFDLDLERAVLRQRLLAAQVREEFESVTGRRLARVGDDLFDGKKKLSISVATVTPVSSKTHFGINVEKAEGLDVETEGLKTYGVDARPFGARVLARFVE